MSYGAGLVGNGWVLESFSPGTSDPGTSRSSMGQMGSPVTRLNVYTNDCLVAWATMGTVLPSMVTSSSTGAVGVSQFQMS